MVGVDRDRLNAPPPGESEGSAGWHGLTATFTGVLIVVGGGVFALRVAHRMPRALWMSLLVIVAGVITGRLINFNANEPKDGPRTDERGYLQTLAGGNEYILTESRSFSPTTFVVLVLVHLAMLPILAAVGWYGLRRLRRPDPDDRSAERTGWIVTWDPSQGD